MTPEINQAFSSKAAARKAYDAALAEMKKTVAVEGHGDNDTHCYFGFFVMDSGEVSAVYRFTYSVQTGLRRHERNAKLFCQWLEKQGIEFSEYVSCPSIYVRTDFGTVRFSDHAEAEDGGFNLSTGERHGSALISVDKSSGLSLAIAKTRFSAAVRGE